MPKDFEFLIHLAIATRTTSFGQGLVVPTLSLAFMPRGFYLCHKPRQQRRPIIFPPDQINRYRDTQVGHRKQFDTARALPSCGLADERDPESARHQAEGGGMIDGVLNDARRTQTAFSACLHDAL